MTVVVQQSVGAIYAARLDNGNVKISVQNFRDVARLELTQGELHALYCELGILLIQPGVKASA